MKKRVVSTLMALAMAVSLAACGGQAATTESAAAEPAAEESTAEEEEPEAEEPAAESEAAEESVPAEETEEYPENAEFWAKQAAFFEENNM